MSTITLRATKGSPLTNTEVDSNFSNLNTDKLESTYAGALNSLTGGSSIITVSSTTGITTGAWKASVIGAAYGGTGVANGATSTITLGGAVTFTGAYTFGATLTANTSVTFPTSGTLATTTGTMASGATWNGNAIGAAYGGTGVANGTNNTITFTGNYTLGLTLTANTAVTLPTSGTLATLAGTETLTNKTLTSPTLTTPSIGVATGTSLALSGLTATQVVFAGTSGLLSSSSGFLYDSTNIVAIIGGGSALGGTTNPTLALSKGANNYIQGYIFNTTNGVNSSADLVAYPNNGTDSNGWIDMGITSQTFSQAAYSVTGANEGYLFMSAPSGSSTTGNLVIATDSTGTANAIQFYTNGFNGTKTAPKMALLSSGALAFTSMTGYGTSGQVLTSNGNAAPTWTTSTAATTGKAIAMAMVFGG